MRHDVATALLAAGDDFAGKVWPIIGPQVGGGVVHRVETTLDGTTERYLDLFAGADALQITPDELIRGVAVRLQAGTDWGTFTVRICRATGLPSELTKRKAALFDPREGYWAPYWTVHAYLDEWGGEVLSAAVVRTRDLIRLVDKGRAGVHYTRRETPDGARFAAVPWETYARHTQEVLGRPAWIYTWRRSP